MQLPVAAVSRTIPARETNRDGFGTHCNAQPM
nr:MAG TPA: hypothetical protein [Caudoviricetes sp.]